MARKDLYSDSLHGVITPRIGAQRGVPSRTRQTWQREEDWDVPFRGAALLPGTQSTGAPRIAAAVAVVGDPVAVTGWSAAYLRGLVAAAPTTVDLAVPDRRRVRRAGIRARRTRAWTDGRIQSVVGLPIVDWPWMLADLSVVATVDRLIAWAFDGIHGHGLRHVDLAQELERRGRFPGRSAYGEMVRRLRPDGSESGFEFRARARMQAARLRPDPEQVVVPTSRGHRRIDIPWSPYRVGVECQSFRHHGGRHAFEQDAQRRNDLTEQGDWEILELTWQMMETTWSPFLRQLTTVLRRRGWKGQPTNAPFCGRLPPNVARSDHVTGWVRMFGRSSGLPYLRGTAPPRPPTRTEPHA